MEQEIIEPQHLYVYDDMQSEDNLYTYMPMVRGALLGEEPPAEREDLESSYQIRFSSEYDGEPLQNDMKGFYPIPPLPSLPNLPHPPSQFQQSTNYQTYNAPIPINSIYSRYSIPEWKPNFENGDALSRPQSRNEPEVTEARYSITKEGFKCLYLSCGKIFDKQTNLKSHLRTHQEVRNYHCNECAATFRRSHDLKRHQRSIHSEAKPYICLQCGKGFSRQVFKRLKTGRAEKAYQSNPKRMLRQSIKTSSEIKKYIKFLDKYL